MTIKKYAPLLAAVSAVGGFVSDVLQPLGPVLLTTVLLALALAIPLTVLRRRLGQRAGVVAGFLWIWAIIGGGFLSLQVLLGANETGATADLVPGVAKMQSRLGILADQIEVVQANTESIKESAGRIESSVAAIDSGIRELGRLGGIIENPATPEEWYGNARLHELKGDFGNARRAYLQCLPGMPDKIDAHLDFVQFLKVQEGTAGAREVYLAVARGTPGVAAKVALAMLLPSAERVRALESIEVDGNIPAPVKYLLANQYSEETLGVQTLSDKQAELEWLEKFSAAVSDGPYLRYFANQKSAEQWISRSTARLASIKATTSARGMVQPVELSVDLSDHALLIEFHVAEPALELHYRTDPKSAFLSTGFSALLDPRTGKPAPNMTISVPHQEQVHIEISYVDMAGRAVGPLDLSFVALDELRRSQKAVLQTDWGKWASYAYEETTREQSSALPESLRPSLPGVRNLDDARDVTVEREYFLDLSYLWQRAFALRRVLYRLEGRGNFGEPVVTAQAEMIGRSPSGDLAFSRDTIRPDPLPEGSPFVRLPTRIFIGAISLGTSRHGLQADMGAVSSRTSVVFLQLEFFDGQLSEERAFPFEYAPNPVECDISYMQSLMTGSISPSGKVDLRVMPDKERYPAEASDWIKVRIREHHWNNATALNRICMAAISMMREGERARKSDWDLAVLREAARRACDLTADENAFMLDTLAMIHWELGDRASAIDVGRQSLARAGTELVWDSVTNWRGPMKSWCMIMLEWYETQPAGSSVTAGEPFNSIARNHQAR